MLSGKLRKNAFTTMVKAIGRERITLSELGSSLAWTSWEGDYQTSFQFSPSFLAMGGSLSELGSS